MCFFQSIVLTSISAKVRNSRNPVQFWKTVCHAIGDAQIPLRLLVIVRRSMVGLLASRPSVWRLLMEMVTSKCPRKQMARSRVIHGRQRINHKQPSQRSYNGQLLSLNKPRMPHHNHHIALCVPCPQFLGRLHRHGATHRVLSPRSHLVRSPHRYHSYLFVPSQRLLVCRRCLPNRHPPLTSIRCHISVLAAGSTTIALVPRGVLPLATFAPTGDLQKCQVSDPRSLIARRDLNSVHVTGNRLDANVQWSSLLSCHERHYSTYVMSPF